MYDKFKTKNRFIVDDIISYYCSLSIDSLPSVRQDAAKILVDLSEVVHLSVFDNKLIPRLKQFSFDQNVMRITIFKNVLLTCFNV